MRFSPLCLLALASLALGDAASDVLKLTSDNFDDTIKNHQLILVEFFAPWYVFLSISSSYGLRFARCGHCKALAPHYEEAATALKEKDIALANVDCVDQADLCQANEVQGYPYVCFPMRDHDAHPFPSRTLKVYKNGVPAEYHGPRKADGIISYMIK